MQLVGKHQDLSMGVCVALRASAVPTVLVSRLPALGLEEHMGLGVL